MYTTYMNKAHLLNRRDHVVAVEYTCVSMKAKPGAQIRK